MLQHIPPHQLQQWLTQNKDITVLDVRTPQEWNFLGHIPNATLISLMDLPQQVSTLDKTKPTAVICEHGVRSEQAAHYLAHLGFTEVYNVLEGMSAWQGPRTPPNQ